jgi:dTDP-4-amino-4,6-dideoxygalactose transaminase
VIPVAKPKIGWRERRAVNRVLRSGNLSQGKEVKLFEEEFSPYVDKRVCVAVNSGTSGLHLALVAAGIGAGDEVIVPSFSFAATANSVALAGATPVFVDIDLNTFNISTEAVEAAITSKTKAIQPVHLYGLPSDMKELQRIAVKHGLLLFEDAAQAHLASIEGKAVGSFGTFATFSFYPTKNMTSGEGGMIVCESEEYGRACRLLRNQGMEKRYENEVIGFNTRMTDIHASIGRVQLQKIATWTQKRQRNAKYLNENLSGVVTPYIPERYSHVFHQYTIRVEGINRDEFAEELRKRGVDSGVYYPKPIHKLPSFNLGFDLPNTKIACEEVLSLPIHPSLSKRDLEKIAETVNKVANAGS